MNTDSTPLAIELIVLDLVGTIVADDGHVESAFEHALAMHGLPCNPDALWRVRGLRKRDAFQQLVHEALAPHTSAELAYQDFRGQLSHAFQASPPRLVPGAAAFLEWAAARPLKLAVNTGLDRGLALSLLDTLPHRFHALVTGDDVAHGRPAPFLIFRAMEATNTICVHRVAVVGDTIADLQAGANAGVRLNVGALAGAHSRAQLGSQPHTHLIESLAELPAILEALPLPGGHG
jgi:phosphonatase-like hydrolase